LGSLAVLSLVSLNGLSRSIETLAPERAFRINPLNTEARVSWLVGKLNEAEPPASDEALLDVAEAAIAITPLDARLHSLIGELRLRAGETEEADRLFRQAYRISHTELHALKYLINRSIEAGDYAGAIGQIDMLLRRWPNRADVVQPILPQLLSQEDAYQALLVAMTSEAPWRWRLISGLSRHDGGLTWAYRILMDLSASDRPPSRGEIGAGIRAFVAAKRYEEAYRLFRFTMPAEERARAGFIHNASFEADSLDVPPFSWQRRNTRAAEITFAGETGSQGATVRFLGTPAKDLVFHQSMVLPAGRYRLSVDVETSSLRAPRGLYWRIRCQDPRKDLLRIDIPEGTYQTQRLEASFDVDQCAYQRIELATDVIAESWQNRYTGLVRFASLRIERAGLAETQD